LRREITIRFRGDPTVGRPSLFKRILMGVAVAAIAIAIMLTALVLGLSLMLIIWLMLAIAIVVAIVRSIFSRPDRVDRF
jgi:hypothetical protein